MVTVYTKEQLTNALKAKENKILCKGEIAKEIKNRKKMTNAAKIAGIAIAAGGLLAIPFTGGLSSGLAIAGYTAGAEALTIGTAAGTTVALTTAELAIITGGGLAALGICLMGLKVTINPNGTVTIEPKYKE